MPSRAILFLFLAIVLSTISLQLTKKPTTEEKVEKSVYFIDPTLLPYVLDYEAELNDRGVQIPANQSFSVLLTRMPMRLAGIAIGMFNNTTVNVAINIRLWNTYTETQKRFLIYHELSHDVFNIEHDSCRLMVTAMSGVNDIYEDFDAIMDELANVIKCSQE